MADRERRILRIGPESGLELRVSGDGRTLEGYAIVFERWSEDLGGFRERVDREAKIEFADDVLATFNHDAAGALLGRTGAKTLELDRDRRGVLYRIALPDTTVGRDVRELVRRGDVAGSSFQFETLKDSWSHDGDRHDRTLESVRVFELGPVTLPAYPDTTAAVRALGEARRAPAADALESLKRRNRVLAIRLGAE